MSIKITREKTFSNNLGDLLIAIRTKLKLRQKDLEAEIGISCKSISKIEIGKMHPSARTIDKVIEFAKKNKIRVRDFL